MKTLVFGLMLAVAVMPSGARAAKKKVAAAGPAASSQEIEKLKGQFKWGMSPDEVMAKVVEKLEATYDARLKATAQDPTKYDRIRKEMMAEVDRARKHSIVKFDGKKTGYDVSIIDQEFTHKAGESMLAAKEESASRYFFFVEDKLYKMFIAFDKEMLQGKGFSDFGKMMQARFGKGREVNVEVKVKGGAHKKLDHYVWAARGDGLRLVDRSGFYDVFCLVLYDGSIEERQAAVRKANAKGERADALIDAVTGKETSTTDVNDDVIDRVTGKSARKPAGEDPTVPSVGGGAVRGGPPSEPEKKPQDSKGKASKGLEL